MTTLVFPECGEDWNLAFNSALDLGEFVSDSASPKFWALFELQASETEDGAIVADLFFQKHTLEFKRIERKETEI